MTVETPAHAERFFLFDNFHLSDIAMTADTANPLGDMNAVIEIGVVWKFMHFDPPNRIAGGIAFPNWEKFFALGKNQGMTIHTGLGGGYY